MISVILNHFLFESIPGLQRGILKGGGPKVVSRYRRGNFDHFERSKCTWLGENIGRKNDANSCATDLQQVSSYEKYVI